MKEKILLIWKHLKQGTLKKMWKQTLWIYQYGRRYWKAMILYTLLGLVGTVVSLVSSLISRDLVDIITGHQTGKLVSTFAAMIGFSVANILVSQASGYASTFINLKVDSEIKNDIFAKMLVTDWESLTDYHTGDLVTRWSSDASNISSGILNWIPNLIIYTFRFISALAIVLYYDPTFALFALLGIPFSALLSKPLLKRMRDNNQRSAAMNAKLYGFNQEAFSNIQTIKAFDLIHFYTEKLKSLILLFQAHGAYPINGFPKTSSVFLYSFTFFPKKIYIPAANTVNITIPVIIHIRFFPLVIKIFLILSSQSKVFCLASITQII